MIPPPPSSLRDTPEYGRFWLAASVSAFGDHFTTLAIQVMVVTALAGTAADVGLVSAARWLPYMLFGVIVGAMIDRLRRRPVMIVADLARAALLTVVPVLAVTGNLSIWALAAFMSLFGLASLMGDAASQAFVPRIVPRSLLVRAHARLDQSSAVAQTSGPALAGLLVSLVGAAWAVIADAATYLFSALMLLTLRNEEPGPSPVQKSSIWRDVKDGIGFVYRHRTLAPLAIGTHAWFVCNGAAGAVFVPFMLQTLALPPSAVGLALSAAGLGALAGSMLAARLDQNLGAGRLMIICQAVSGLGFGLIALAPGGALAWACLCLGQFAFGFSIGGQNAATLSYRQSVTPDNLQGRMNATMRSLNRAMVVIAAPLGGLLADAIGYREALWFTVAGFFAVALTLAATPLREARTEARTS